MIYLKEAPGGQNTYVYACSNDYKHFQIDELMIINNIYKFDDGLNFTWTLLVYKQI